MHSLSSYQWVECWYRGIVDIAQQKCDDLLESKWTIVLCARLYHNTNEHS